MEFAYSASEVRLIIWCIYKKQQEAKPSTVAIQLPASVGVAYYSSPVSSMFCHNARISPHLSSNQRNVFMALKNFLTTSPSTIIRRRNKYMTEI